jgi:uncharacterized protein YbjT (DUF2867 family)
VDILARRNPASALASTKLNAFIDADTSKWASHYKSLSPPPSIFFSGLATTRAAAGGFDNQYKIDHDFNVEMARAAKEAGSKVYVLISASNASPNSKFGYPKMKGQTEEDIEALGFDHTVFIRTGMISGYRQENLSLLEGVLRNIANGLGTISSHYLKDAWAQDADVIAKAAVSAGLKALNGEAPSKVWVITRREIIQQAQED